MLWQKALRIYPERVPHPVLIDLDDNAVCPSIAKDVSVPFGGRKVQNSSWLKYRLVRALRVRN
jgi:hypothetical protein